VVWNRSSVREELVGELNDAEILWLLVMAEDHKNYDELRVVNRRYLVGSNKTTNKELVESKIESYAKELGVEVDRDELDRAYRSLDRRSFTAGGIEDTILDKDKSGDNNILRLTTFGDDLVHHTIMQNEGVIQDLKDSLSGERQEEEEENVDSWFPPKTGYDPESSTDPEVHMEINSERPEDLDGPFEREVTAEFLCQDPRCSETITHSYMVEFWSEAYDDVSVRCDCGSKNKHLRGDPYRSPKFIEDK